MLRYSALFGCFILAGFAGAFARQAPGWAAAAALFFIIGMVGLRDLIQRKRTLLRNYPLLAHLRYQLESIGPEIRQYFIESDTAEVPFSRQQRALVYQRAKGVVDTRPFGTQRNVYQTDHEWINHSMQPTTIADHDFRVEIGSTESQKYSASIFNISAMSFGALSGNAIEALNLGARRGHFFHDTGEGGVSRYHSHHGGDLVWQIGTGYFGCRNASGEFDADAFSLRAVHPQVRMIEIKLSQGAKPGQGGILPAAKVSREVAAARGIPEGRDSISPGMHSAFSDPKGLLQFVCKLRRLSGGKPTGIKLALGHPWEWFSLAKAMQEWQLYPDFIVIDGAEGGTGTAPAEFLDHVGLPLQEGLMLVHNTLVGLGIRTRVRLGAAGKIVSGFDIAKTMAMGADWCNAARGFMFSLGCIQALRCHTGNCPTGIATQNPRLAGSLDVEDKAERVFQFHANTLRAVADLISAAGLTSPSQLRPEHVLRRVSPAKICSFATLYRFVEPGQLLHEIPNHAVFRQFWNRSSPDSFSLLDELHGARISRMRTASLR